MKRGDLYRIYKGSKHDPKNYRICVVVSRQVLIESQFSTVVCAPVYTNCTGESTQVSIDIEDGLKHHSCIFCDELLSIPKQRLTDYIGTLSFEKLKQLNEALMISLGIK